jgi:hypothetical protein
VNEQIVELSEWDIEFVEDEPRVGMRPRDHRGAHLRWTWAMENAQTVIYRPPSRRYAGH